MSDDFTSMRDDDQEWHDSFKPSWGPEAILVYAMPSNIRSSDAAVLEDSKLRLISEGRDVRFAKFIPTPSVSMGCGRLLRCTSLTTLSSRQIRCHSRSLERPSPQNMAFPSLRQSRFRFKIWRPP